MNENIDLTKILKDCPKGWKFYSPICGEVKFIEICDKIKGYHIRVTDWFNSLGDVLFTKEGFYFLNKGAECILFPSKDQRDWSKFKAPWLKKPKFDPKTLQPFDKVLVRDYENTLWICGLFSFMLNNKARTNCSWNYCIPYNDDTKHLVGTTEEAPEYYRYWED